MTNESKEYLESVRWVKMWIWMYGLMGTDSDI